MGTSNAIAGTYGTAGDRDWSALELRELDLDTRQRGRELFALVAAAAPKPWQRQWWNDRLLAWSMRREALKVELFRFVDVLPMLTSSHMVLGHLLEYMKRAGPAAPHGLVLALQLAQQLPGVRSLAAALVRRGAGDFARQFIAGANLTEIAAAVQMQRRAGRHATLDILGEAVLTGREAEQHAARYAELIETLAPRIAAWPEVAALDHSAYGPRPRLNVSIKLSALDAAFDPIDPAGVLRRAGGRLRTLLRVAQQHGAFINIDMESYEKKDLTLHVVRTILAEPEFRTFADVGVVIQCYLRDAADDLAQLRDWAQSRGTPLWVRLVKGAYWDYETVVARSRAWPVPVFQCKAESDANYERLTRYLLAEREWLHPAFASHNVRSLAHVLAAATALKVPANAYEVQMLYGMADAEKTALVARGQTVRVYMPLGDLLPGMAYLVRRLLENTSNQSFLRAGFLEHVAIDELLRSPEERLAAPTSTAAVAPVVPSAEFPTMTAPRADFAATFANQPGVDFSRASSRANMIKALNKVRPELGKHLPLRIGGSEVDTAERLSSVDPSCSSRMVATSAAANAEHVARAVALARAAQLAWWQQGVASRAACLQRAADSVEQRLYELAAWEVYECGKPWREATADIDEAIDFLRYYAREAMRLEQPQGADVPGEQNRFTYLPRGVVGVIAPWNFPLAIISGMAAAALATGNTVLLKPAEQAVAMGHWLWELLTAAGVPANVVQFLPGRGSVTGAAIVEHPHVAMIVFTGSRETGLLINQQAAAASLHAPQVKRVVAEMGGKNAIVVDDSADLDEAVAGVVKSAFGFAGQKCSACSRAIVLPAIYDTFVDRLLAAVHTLRIGPAEDPATDVGPVIDAAARAKVQAYQAVGREEGKELALLPVGPLADQGFFASPAVYGEIQPHHRLAREEIFGPVLAVLRARDFSHALELANDSPFALTGGVYSRTPSHLEQARLQFEVGNLYLNRPITGALVGRQPFGGFRQSGFGSKAGGADYLGQFVLARAVTENTLRRGFAPEATP